MKLLANRDDGKGQSEVLFDAEDAATVGDWKWRVSTGGYAYRKIVVGDRQVQISMHRAILNLLAAPRNVEVDHVNGNKLDNRRCNIRICTRGLNNAARGKRATYAGKKPSSRFRGVTWAKDKKRWQAQIGFRGKNLIIGRYLSEEDAARAYDEMARLYYGEFANPNFP